MYSSTGRPSIPPERRLKGQLLIALYSVRSDRQFCQMLDYNILFRWFLDMSLDEPGLDQSAFSRLRERLVSEDIALFDAVVRRARGQGLLSSDHFTVDGTLVEAWASQHQERQTQERSAAAFGWPGRRELPRPAAHERHERILYRSRSKVRTQRSGKEAKLSYAGHALMENRNGLCVTCRSAPMLAKAA